VATRESAERSLRDAVTQGERFGAVSCSLRAGISLARLMRSRGQITAANDLLSAQVSSFSGDRASADLDTARALLSELEGAAGGEAPRASKRSPEPPL
jgi:hypothetical protein